MASSCRRVTLPRAGWSPVSARCSSVSAQPRSGPVLIQRKDQERVVYVSANISGRDMGSVLADIKKGRSIDPVLLVGDLIEVES